jgi:hypothetical protein
MEGSWCDELGMAVYTSAFIPCFSLYSCNAELQWRVSRFI